MPSGYKAVIGLAAIVLLALLWIPIYEIYGGTGGIVDSFNTIATDADVINANESARLISYWILFIFIIVIVIWVLKEEKGVQVVQ